jgi:hypothetical protein
MSSRTRSGQSRAPKPGRGDVQGIDGPLTGRRHRRCDNGGDGSSPRRSPPGGYSTRDRVVDP